MTDEVSTLAHAEPVAEASPISGTRMELIHGSAELRSQNGEGTTVTLWMPLPD